MKNKSVRKRSMQKSLDTILQNVLDMLEADDGRNPRRGKKLLLQKK